VFQYKAQIGGQLKKHHWFKSGATWLRAKMSIIQQTEGVGPLDKLMANAKPIDIRTARFFFN
jgi:hypothetical protein